MSERIEEILRGAGLTDRPDEYGDGIHSWRCEHPDRYGRCGCFAELVDALTEHDRQVAERAWDEGRSAVIAYAVQHVENEPEHLEGYIDQHIVGIGGSKLGNPYRAAKGEQK